MPRHDWNTVNREVHEPESLTLADVVEEIRVALVDMTEAEASRLIRDLDLGYYATVGRTIAKRLKALGGEESV
jgi:hypothetical protein